LASCFKRNCHLVGKMLAAQLKEKAFKMLSQ